VLSQYRACGLTLIELIMALASTMVLLLALSTMLITLNKNIAREDALNQIQENANYAIRILRNAIHQAGTVDFPKLQGLAHEITVRDASKGMNTYLVENTDRAGVSALYELNQHQRKTELVEGITDIHFTYEVKIKRQNQITTLEADQIKDWFEVVGINVEFTVTHFPFTKHWKSYIAL
jgi:type II secretory pathway component PulJ